MDDQENHLVSPPPRDALIIRRQAAIESYKKRRAGYMADKHQSILKEFSQRYFKREIKFNDLSLAEKKALAEICFRRSITNLFFIFSPYLAGLAILNFFLPKNILDFFLLNFFCILGSGLGILITTAIQDIYNHPKINNYFNVVSIVSSPDGIKSSRNLVFRGFFLLPMVFCHVFLGLC